MNALPARCDENTMTEKLVIFPLIGSPAIAICAIASGPLLAIIIAGMVLMLAVASFV